MNKSTATTQTPQSSVYRRAEKIYGFTIEARDGEVGKVKDLYFDDQDWTICYLIIDTGPWILGRKLLFSPDGLASPRWDEKIFPVDLTKEEVKKSPDIDLEKPVSQQNLVDLHEYYEWPSRSYLPLDATMYPVITPHPINSIQGKRDEFNTAQQAQAPSYPHLRSTKEVIGYSIQATDGKIGHVDDFFIGDTDWTIRYMLVDTKDWLPGRKVLVSPMQILRVEWPTHEVYVDLTRKQIKDSPEYDPENPIEPAYELEYFRRLGFDPYWIRDA